MNNEEVVVLERSIFPRRAARALLVLCAAFLSLVLLPASVRAQDWIISVLEGEAVVIDGLKRMNAVPGQRLEPGAIIETAAKTGILRIESADQTTYDLGPDTRVMLTPPGFPPRNDRPPQIYLLQGWLKGTARGPRDAAGIVTPALELLPFKGAVVLQQLKREHVAFVENGRIDLIERRVGSGSIAINAGEFYGGEGARRGSVAARPAPAWLQGVPRAFRDPVPLRFAAARDRRAEGATLPGPTYAHLADWLTSEMTLRASLPGRFAPLVRDAAFRNEINARMPAHPEWAPVIAADTRARRTGGNR